MKSNNALQCRNWLIMLLKMGFSGLFPLLKVYLCIKVQSVSPASVFTAVHCRAFNVQMPGATCGIH